MISGFLGQASDWDSFKAQFAEKCGLNINFTISTLSEDLKKISHEKSEDSFANWARMMEKELSDIKPEIVIAYSMGGRLFSHVDVSKISSLKKIIFISNHWGLTQESDKLGRIEKDQVWSERFLQWPWGAIMREWNSQTVFSSDVKRPDRNEKNYDRQILADTLSCWTLGKQSLRDLAVKSWPIKKYWIHGEKDALYSRLADRSASIGCEVLNVVGAGHSPHITHPRELSDLILAKKII